jgi:hypothetical protein
MCGCGKGNVNREVVTSQQLAAQMAASEAQHAAALRAQQLRDKSLASALENSKGANTA